MAQQKLRLGDTLRWNGQPLKVMELKKVELSIIAPCDEETFLSEHVGARCHHLSKQIDHFEEGDTITLEYELVHLAYFDADKGDWNYYLYTGEKIYTKFNIRLERKGDTPNGMERGKEVDSKAAGEEASSTSTGNSTEDSAGAASGGQADNAV